MQLNIFLIQEIDRFKGYIRINESSRLISEMESENTQNEIITTIIL